LIHPAIWPQHMWAENWGTVPLWGGELDPHLTQCGQGRGLPASQVLSWSIQPFGHNTPTLQRIRGFGDDALYKSTFYITLHYITDRTYRTGQRSDSIGRTI